MGKQAEFDSNTSEAQLSEPDRPLLDSLLNHTAIQTPGKQVEGYPYSLIGAITAFDEDGYALVTFSIDNKQYQYRAQATVKLELEQLGQGCVLVFNQGKFEQPIIIGVVQPPKPADTSVNGERPVVIQSDAGIVLKCGSSRIELMQDGTINIQGMHINNQAYGPNRIKGGSVKIN